MAYNLATIRTSVKNRIADPNFNNALIDEFINSEQREVLGYYNLPFNRTSIRHTINQGENTITLPPKHQKTLGLRIVAPQNEERDLSRQFMPWNRFKEAFREPQYYSEADLLYWSIFNTEIIFAWDADKTYEVEQDYLVAPDELINDTDVPVLPEEFKEILILGAMVRSLEVNDDNDIAQYQQGKKNLLVQAMLKRYSPQQSAKTNILRNSYRGI